jgi:hypothetical protein
VSIFIDPFDVGGWRLVLVLMTLDDGSHIHRCPWAPVATPTAVVAVSLRYHGTTRRSGRSALDRLRMDVHPVHRHHGSL